MNNKHIYTESNHDRPAEQENHAMQKRMVEKIKPLLKDKDLEIVQKFICSTIAMRGYGNEALDALGRYVAKAEALENALKRAAPHIDVHAWVDECPSYVSEALAVFRDEKI